MPCVDSKNDPMRIQHGVVFSKTSSAKLQADGMAVGYEYLRKKNIEVKLFQFERTDNLVKYLRIVVNTNKILCSRTICENRNHNIGVIIAAEVAPNCSFSVVSI